MAAKQLIAFECVAKDHHATPVHPDKLTVHDGAWAFCPFDAHADGHEWRHTGGIDLDGASRRAGLSALATAIASPESDSNS